MPARRQTAALLVAPAVLTIITLMLIPMAIAFGYSVLTSSPYGGVDWPLTGESYLHLILSRDFDGHLAFDPTVPIVLARSIVQAGLATLVCIAIGLPLAWWMATRPPRLRQALVLLVTVPFWTNLLIRTYCWVLILRDNGLVNQALADAHLTSAPITFLYSDGAVLLGIVYANLPFMVLPLYAALEKVDPRTIEAAFDLYAGRSTVFRRLVWPLARPGIAAGTLLVFVPALGSFLAPDILGGGRKLMIGTLIQQQFTTARDWSFGAALSMLLMGAVLIALTAGAWRRAARSALPRSALP